MRTPYLFAASYSGCPFHLIIPTNSLAVALMSRLVFNLRDEYDQALHKSSGMVSSIKWEAYTPSVYGHGEVQTNVSEDEEKAGESAS